MKATDYIKLSLESSQGWAIGLLADMESSPLTQPTPNGGNHPLWVLGHMTFSESALLDQFILGKPNRFEEWREIFGMGSQPSTDASQYPPFQDVMAKFQAMREETFAYLDTLSDDDLDQPSHAPEEFGPMFGTVAGVFTAMSNHVMFHAGQVSDARRTAGRDVLMA